MDNFYLKQTLILIANEESHHKGLGGTREIEPSATQTQKVLKKLIEN